MMEIQKNVSLRAFNTFDIEVKAGRYVEITSVPQLQALLAAGQRDVFILGGGSNILLTRDVDLLVLRNCIAGREVIAREGDTILVAAGGGENWHGLVEWTLGQDFGGLENLSLIPGTVGAAPIQNIGAYGVELSDVFEYLEAVSLDDGARHTFDRAACRFGYRDSIFKGEGKGRYFITRVFLRLTWRNHRIDVSYGPLRSTLREMGVEQPVPADVSRAVIAVRRSKLPDPAVIGNAGSFFKNPRVSPEVFHRLLGDNPVMPHYLQADGTFKIPAGWLIEQCGWKGRRLGPVGCYEKQALVLVNYGGATGRDVLNLASQIIDSVKERFGIDLEMEVNVV